MNLARFEFGQAFMYHPLFFVVPFVPLLGMERLTAKQRNIWAFALLGVLIAVWVVRMVLLFPDTPPMTFNENSMMGWLFRR